MAALKSPLTWSRRSLLITVGATSVGFVGAGVWLAQTMNLAACPLCILQRMLYLLLGVEALLAALLGAPRLVAWLMTATAATGAYWAAYQTWLQRFAKDVSCIAEQPWWERIVNWAGSKSPLLFEATGLCSEAGWKFIGLSIAEWSMIVFVAMAVTCLYTLRRPAR